MAETITQQVFWLVSQTFPNVFAGYEKILTRVDVGRGRSIVMFAYFLSSAWAHASPMQAVSSTRRADAGLLLTCPTPLPQGTRLRGPSPAWRGRGRWAWGCTGAPPPTSPPRISPPATISLASPRRRYAALTCCDSRLILESLVK